jgi:hypothetical protein
LLLLIFNVTRLVIKPGLKMLSGAGSTLFTPCCIAHGTRLDSICSGTLQVPIGGYVG